MELFNNDCVNKLKDFYDECIDMTVTSPPYDNLRTYNLEKLSVDYKALAKELYRVTKKGGVVAWIVQDQTINGDKDGTSIKRNDKWCDKVVSEYGVRFNVWDIPTEKKNKTGHPAVFPLKLASDLITSWSNEDDVILDPFMGSGTTGLACKELGRRFIGIELNKEYFKNTKKRLLEI